MSLDLPKGAEIIIPSFTYIAPVEAAVLLGYKVVFADVDANSFNITLENIKKVYNKNVRAVVAVHLFGQHCADIRDIYHFCLDNHIFLIEDNAQSLASEKNITRNSLITTSFFPTKNLGAFGDGGAVLTNDDRLAKKIKQIAGHGQSKKYEHELVGINSRLDAIQAAILKVKLKYLDTFIRQRRAIAAKYNEALASIPAIQIPHETGYHTYHQYTIKVEAKHRNNLQKYLKENGMETTVYYPIPAHLQQAYRQNITLKTSETLSQTVLSLPIFPELKHEKTGYILNKIKEFWG
jgi:dTDP-4-amino-4,6-dideoxygalactose transaminase